MLRIFLFGRMYQGRDRQPHRSARHPADGTRAGTPVSLRVMHVECRDAMFEKSYEGCFLRNFHELCTCVEYVICMASRRLYSTFENATYTTYSNS